MDLTTKKEEKQKRSKVTIAVNVVFIAALTFLAIAIVTAIKYKNNPDDAYLFGIKPIYIETGSMEPTLKTGSIAIVKKADISDFEIDDIVVFVKDKKLITHRVIKVGDGYLKTKGDNNKIYDNFSVYPEEVRAKLVFPINFIATFKNEIGTVKGVFKWIVFPIICIIIIVVTIRIIIKILRSDTDNKKTDNPNETEHKAPEIYAEPVIEKPEAFDDFDEDMYFSSDYVQEDDPNDEAGLEVNDRNTEIVEEKEETNIPLYTNVEIVKEKKNKAKKKPTYNDNEDNNEQVEFSSKREMEDWRCN